MPRALTQLVVLVPALLVLAAVGAWAYRTFGPHPPDPVAAPPELATHTVAGVRFEVEHRPGEYTAVSADESVAFTRGGDLLDYEDGVITVNGIGFPGPKPGDLVRWNLDGPLLINGEPQAPHPLQPRQLPVPGGRPSWDHRGGARPRDTLGVDWSRTGRVLVTASGDGAARVWDPDKPEVRATLVPDPPKAGGRDGWGLRAAVSPDGKTVAAASIHADDVTLWDVATKARLATLSAPAGKVTAVAFAGDGQLLEARGGTLYRRELSGDRSKVEEIGKVHTQLNPPFAVSADGSMLAANDGSKVTVSSSSGPRSTVGKVTDAACLGLSADGELLALYDGTSRLALYDARTGAVKQRLRWRADQRGPIPVGAMAFSPDGKTLVVGEEGSVRLYDVASGRERGWVKTPAVRALAYSVDGRTLAAGLRTTPGVQLWEMSDLVAK
ncbi:MAG: hypothetical protein JWO38_7342 [Gemmataceae bacterium]|nr:hypothetical protein [Gemmataceae bacterium]